jgi:hypothetical protein
MINEIEQRMNAGEEVPDCLAKTLIEAGQRDELDFLDRTMICSAFMIGGVETVCIYLLKALSHILPRQCY